MRDKSLYGPVAARTQPTQPAVRLVSLNSALQALNHVSFYNGCGRLAEATAMLVEAQPAPVVPASVPAGYALVPEIADEPMQKAMQVAVMLRKSMNDVWRAGLHEAPAAPQPLPLHNVAIKPRRQASA